MSISISFITERNASATRKGGNFRWVWGQAKKKTTAVTGKIVGLDLTSVRICVLHGVFFASRESVQLQPLRSAQNCNASSMDFASELPKLISQMHLQLRS